MPTTSDTNTPSIAVEDYLKHIWKIVSQGDRATTKALADRMGLGNGTVTGMLKHLAARDLVKYEPYRGVELSEQGERLALRVIRRHRLIELFLVQTLGLGWDEVDEDAERLEHAFSDELIERIDAFLGYPQVDPHGAPIPTAAGRVEMQDFAALSTLHAGQRGLVRRVSDSDPAFLKYLDDHAIALDALIEVIAVDPFGTIHVRIGPRESHLAREAARRIHVAVQPSE
ncbi:MAG: metal-dependent transcriptional regulator [Planctomycetes bacterium]|nr:metal-dependent transcriptional regulator [Planctomycetota bacterium]